MLNLTKLNPRLAHCYIDSYQLEEEVSIKIQPRYSFSEQELSDLLNTVLALQSRKSPELVKQGLGEDLIDITLNE